MTIASLITNNPLLSPHSEHFVKSTQRFAIYKRPVPNLIQTIQEKRTEPISDTSIFSDSCLS